MAKKKRSFTSAELVGRDKADCRRRWKVALLAGSKKWKSPDAFLKECYRKFKWFDEVYADPDWAAFLALIMEMIQNKT